MQVVDAEGAPHNDSGMEALIFTAEGDMRQALNNAQATHAGFGLISSENVFRVRDAAPPPLCAGPLGAWWCGRRLMARRARPATRRCAISRTRCSSRRRCTLAWRLTSRPQTASWRGCGRTATAASTWSARCSASSNLSRWTRGSNSSSSRRAAPHTINPAARAPAHPSWCLAGRPSSVAPFAGDRLLPHARARWT